VFRSGYLGKTRFSVCTNSTVWSMDIEFLKETNQLELGLNLNEIVKKVQF